MESKPLTSMTPQKNAVAERENVRDPLGAQTPLAVIGLAAIGMILLINSHARPTASHVKPGEIVVACSDCGTVIAVRRAADAVPSFIVDVQMLDGSLRSIRQPGAGINVGDIVQVNGTALTLRSAAS